MTFGTEGYALAAGEGEGLWFTDSLYTVKAGGPETGEALTVIEARMPHDLRVPPHVHHREDEAFYVLAGRLSITCGDRTWTAGPGAFALLPREIPHSFAVSGGEEATMLQLSWPAQFERFAAAMGEPAAAMTLPEPREVDVPELMRIATEYGIEILGPP